MFVIHMPVPKNKETCSFGCRQADMWRKEMCRPLLYVTYWKYVQFVLKTIFPKI